MAAFRVVSLVCLCYIATSIHSVAATKHRFNSDTSTANTHDSTTAERSDSTNWLPPNLEPQGSESLVPTFLVLNVALLKGRGDSYSSIRKDVQMNKDHFYSFANAMCKDNVETIELRLYLTTVTDVIKGFGTTSSGLSNFYLCDVDNRTLIICTRLSYEQKEGLCEDGDCTPDWTIRGGSSGCELGNVGVFWTEESEVSIEYIHPLVSGRFECHKNCQSSGSNSGEDNDIADDTTGDPEIDDGSISTIIIGIIIICVILFLIVAVAFGIWVFRVMKKNRPLKHLSSGNSTSFEGVDIGHRGGFQKKTSSSNLFRMGAGNAMAARTNSTGTQGYVSFHAGSAESSSASVGDGPETTYAYIDERFMNKSKNYYSVIADKDGKTSTQDKNPYPSDHPKNRPALPLPAHVTSLPVPYYSQAQLSENNSANDNSDVVSGAYIEIIEDESDQANQSTNQDSSVPTNLDLNASENVYTKARAMEHPTQRENTTESDGYNSPNHKSSEPEIEGDTAHPLLSYTVSGLDNPTFEDSEIPATIFQNGAVSRIEIKHSPKNNDKEHTSPSNDSPNPITELQGEGNP